MTTYEAPQVAAALKLDVAQFANLAAHLPAGALSTGTNGRQMVAAAAVETLVAGNDPAMVTAFRRLVSTAEATTPTGPTDAQRAAAAQAVANVKAFREGAAPTVPPDRVAAVDEARANARAWRNGR